MNRVAGPTRRGPDAAAEPTVVVVEHDPAWAARFEALRARLAPALAGVASSIEHVGSTSVPGLPAKPIVDLDVVVPDAAAVPMAVARLAALGYVHRGDLGIPGREAFVAPSDAPAHHLYVCVEGSGALANHRAVRDALRADPEKVRAYAELKRRLARTHPHEVDAYMKGKTDFLVALLRAAGLPANVLDEVEAANR